MGRIPNFKGAEAASERMFQSDVFQAAEIIKSNPDSPQRKLRHLALKANKTVYIAVPKLAQSKPFIELNPRKIDEKDYWLASSIKGSSEFGLPVAIEEMLPIDLILTGCVAVSRNGARLGKGGGYADLEYGLLREAKLVHEDTPVVTTVHDVQVLPSGSIEMLEHDTSIDMFSTPTRLIKCRRKFSRPPGIILDALEKKKIESIPVLQSQLLT